MKRKHVTRFGLTLFVGVLMFSLSACNLPYYQIVLAHNQATDNGADNDITKISAPTLEITYTP